MLKTRLKLTLTPVLLDCIWNKEQFLILQLVLL
jgi:hypothetical protein